MTLLRSMWMSLPLLMHCAACGGGTESIVHLNDGVAPHKPTFNEAGIAVFAERTIGREVEELGTVGISTQSELLPDEYLRRMRKEAAKIGADAIIGYEIMDGTATGIAVRYKGP
ncbi:MAG: hypothetical protein H6Q30_1320 [Bacteroidetes bacterium]|nr:hypothetical protein [Bacteroidota bacterium]